MEINPKQFIDIS